MREIEDGCGHPTGNYSEFSYPVSTRRENKCVDPDTPWWKKSSDVFIYIKQMCKWKPHISDLKQWEK